MNTEQITGTPTAKSRAKQLAKPHGGKPGQAMANQSAKYSEGEKPALEGKKVMRANSASRQVQGKEPGPLNPAHGISKPAGRLARGIDSHDAPHSAAAVRSNREASAKDAKPVGKGGKLAKVAQPKAAKTKTAIKKEAKAARSGTRKITVVCKDASKTNIRPDSDRFAKLAWVIKNKPATTADAIGKMYKPGKKLAAGCLAGMVKRGHITLA